MYFVSFLKKVNKIDWCHSIYFNFNSLPLCQAIKLPILLYGHSTINVRNGKVRINIERNKLRFGIIKLGIRHEISCISNIGVQIENYGTIIFNGSMLIGNGSVISVKKGATLEFGRNIGITGDFKIHCHDRIKLGNLLSCAWNVTICDTDFHTILDARTKQILPRTAPVVIGDNVWICQNVTILKGVIANKVTVAAYSLVNKDWSNLDDYSVLGGVVCKLLNTKIIRQDIQEIEKLREWDITEGYNVFNEIK